MRVPRLVARRAGALLTWEARNGRADVLMVTNMWPDHERPVYGIFVQRQVESLRTQGLSCDVLYIRGYRSAFAYVMAAAYFAARGRALSRRYKLVHVHAGETALPTRLLLGVPMLVSFCGDDLLGYPSSAGGTTSASRLRSAVIRHWAGLFTATLTKSREMEAALPLRVRGRNHVIPNGVDRMAFHPSNRDEARRALGWSLTSPVVLFAATRPEEARKRLWLAQAACGHASSSVGPIQLELADNVTPSEIPLLMNAADCLLLTSALEGSPNVVKEALMCNLPVVSTDVGDVAEVLVGVEPSFVTEPTAKALGDAVATVVNRRERSNGRDVAQWLDAEAVARRVIALYDSLAREPLAVSTRRDHSLRAA